MVPNLAIFGENEFFRKPEIERFKWKTLSGNLAGKVNLVQRIKKIMCTGDIYPVHPVWSTYKLLNILSLILVHVP